MGLQWALVGKIWLKTTFVLVSLIMYKNKRKSNRVAVNLSIGGCVHVGGRDSVVDSVNTGMSEAVW
jgi:hypothetical protein